MHLTAEKNQIPKGQWCSRGGGERGERRSPKYFTPSFGHLKNKHAKLFVTRCGFRGAKNVLRTFAYSAPPDTVAGLKGATSGG